MVTMQAKGGIFRVVEAYRVAPGHGAGADVVTWLDEESRTTARRWRARCGWVQQSSAEAPLWHVAAREQGKTEWRQTGGSG